MFPPQCISKLSKDEVLEVWKWYRNGIHSVLHARTKDDMHRNAMYQLSRALLDLNRMAFGTKTDAETKTDPSAVSAP